MKLLLDENLSWRLKNALKNDFEEIEHLTNTILPNSPYDTIIWKYAKEQEYTIVTNDEDFYLLAMSRGFPPKIILLRTGNQSTKYITQVRKEQKSEIEQFIGDEEYGVLEIY